MSIPLTAKILRPTDLTDAMLLSSTIPEPDASMSEVAWVSGATYALNEEAIRTTTHKIYRRRVAGAGTTVPEDDPTNWLDIGFTNRWRQFDKKVGTSSTKSAGPLTSVMRPGFADGLFLGELVGRSVDVTVKSATGGTVIYGPKNIDLDGTLIEDVYDWFFSDLEQRTDVILTDLPRQYSQAEITVTVNGTSTVSVGVCKVGRVDGIGSTLAGATVGIVDYSLKQADAFGNIEVVERSYSKRNNYKVVTNPADFNRIFRRLAGLRATACVWIGTEQVGFEPLLVYGYFKSFSIDVAYRSHHLCDLEIEGLI